MLACLAPCALTPPPPPAPLRLLLLYCSRAFTPLSSATPPSHLRLLRSNASPALVRRRGRAACLPFTISGLHARRRVRRPLLAFRQAPSPRPGGSSSSHSDKACAHTSQPLGPQEGISYPLYRGEQASAKKGKGPAPSRPPRPVVGAGAATATAPGGVDGGGVTGEGDGGVGAMWHYIMLLSASAPCGRRGCVGASELVRASARGGCACERARRVCVRADCVCERPCVRVCARAHARVYCNVAMRCVCCDALRSVGRILAPDCRGRVDLRRRGLKSEE